MGIIIFCPFREDFSLNTGSNIRIKAYSEVFTKDLADCIFLAPICPEYISEDVFKAFSLKPRFKKLFILHNLFADFFLLKWLSFLIWKFLSANKDVQFFVKLCSQDKILLSHQENSIGLFMKIRYNKDFIYDIHGILNIQKEYLDGMSLWERLWFHLSKLNEKIVFQKNRYVNSISMEMTEFIENKFGFRGHSFNAPDGILELPNLPEKTDSHFEKIFSENNLSKKDKILLFFGSFKKLGGVLFLTEVFCEISKSIPDLKLVLIGSGQMESLVHKTIKKYNLTDRFVHLREIQYEHLIYYQKISELIIIPDLKNTYNEIIPHIKTYDTIASRGKILIPDFKVNRDLIKLIDYPALFFKPSDKESLKEKIGEAINLKINSSDISDKKIKQLLFKEKAKALISQYRKIGIIE